MNANMLHLNEIPFLTAGDMIHMFIIYIHSV